ncbi:peptidase domain protein [Thalassoporum mexicanum PCC 7367]|uniref:calcium-binding protein n=1 Tax=Thalassoporum mexicanum TaxID=3457544 RepID=UPI00029FFDBA|nr:calcium-binding protein [Pseudanabaena sp. PCC 7367]AFY69044.1 peptidase domain protein [Pseudanabaena sp. PCC 7367]
MSGFDQSLTLVPGASQTIIIPSSILTVGQSASVTVLSADITGEDFSPFIEVLNPDGSVLTNGVATLDSDVQPNTFTRTINIPSVVDGGSYQVVISDSRDGDNPNPATRFTVEVDSELGTFNNQANENTPEIGSDRSFAGWVGATDPDDFYQIPLTATGTIEASLSSVSADADIELLADDGTTVLATGGEDDSITFDVMDADSTFFIRVFRAAEELPGDASDEGNGSTTYTLDLTIPESPQETPVTITPPTTTTESPNEPTGLDNIVGGGFFNFTDGDDNVNLADVPESAGISIRALSGNDLIIGTDGNEFDINGNQGNDTIEAGDGNDAVMRGGKGSDSIDGGSGNDILNGNNDNDTVVGGNGDDTIRGGMDNDILLGGSGNDFLIGDLGQDILTGEGGSDVFVLRSDGGAAASTLAEADVVTDFSNVFDRIGLSGGTNFSDLTFEAVNLTLGADTPVAATAIRVGTDGDYLGIVAGIDIATLDNASLFIDASGQLNFG